MPSDARIIVVDDDVVFCETLAESLAKRDYQVVQAQSPLNQQLCLLCNLFKHYINPII